MSANLKKAEEESWAYENEYYVNPPHSTDSTIPKFSAFPFPGTNMEMTMTAQKADSVVPATYKDSINVI